jgi:hypothetical protein
VRKPGTITAAFSFGSGGCCVARALVSVGVVIVVRSKRSDVPRMDLKEVFHQLVPMVDIISNAFFKDTR